MASRILMAILVVAFARTTAAQSTALPLDVSGTFITTDSGQFHTRDIGIGGRLGWRLSSLLGVEGELSYHSDPLSDAESIGAGRIEGLFGVTVGPRLGRLRPFAMLRPGFVRYRAADGPVACIAIFPPPLSCTLEAGRTLFAFDAGGGIEFSPSLRTLVRATLSDRMIRYPGPAFDSSGERHDDSFAGHDLRFALGAGFRF